jgi:hypothetical protein
LLKAVRIMINNNTNNALNDGAKEAIPQPKRGMIREDIENSITPRYFTATGYSIRLTSGTYSSSKNCGVALCNSCIIKSPFLLRPQGGL